MILILAASAGCSEPPAARIGRIQAWAKSADAGSAEKIAPFASDIDRDVRIAALQSLASMHSAAAEAAAVTALGDEDPAVRAASVGCLTQLGARARLPEISDLMGKDTDAQVRRQCVAFARRIREEQATALIAGAVRDPDPAVRLLAVQALADVDPLFALDPLAGAVLDDPDWEVRAEAARVLGSARRPEAAAALDAALNDPNEFVRAAASAARKQLKPE